MNNEIISQLKKLNAIQPDPVFARHTRRKIIADKNRFFGIPVSPRVILMGSLSFAILVITLIVPVAFPGQQVPAALSADAINKEYDNLSINIRLKEIIYDQTAQQTISSAINEITETKGKHMNTGVLKAESAGILNSNDVMNSEIDVDALLDKVIN